MLPIRVRQAPSTSQAPSLEQPLLSKLDRDEKRRFVTSKEKSLCVNLNQSSSLDLSDGRASGIGIVTSPPNYGLPGVCDVIEEATENSHTELSETGTTKLQMSIRSTSPDFRALAQRIAE